MQAPHVAAELRDIVPERCNRRHLPFVETDTLLLYTVRYRIDIYLADNLVNRSR